MEHRPRDVRGGSGGLLASAACAVVVLGSVAGAAQAEVEHGRGGDRHGHEARDWRGHHRHYADVVPNYGYAPPPMIAAPPSAYAPPPVVYSPPPSISFVIPLR